MAKLLQVENLGKTFNTRNASIKVFADVTFSLGSGEIIAITGRSGVGKSTLLSLLSGLDRPTSGKVLFQEKSLEELSLSQLAELRANKIGMIFQSFNLISSWTALENVEAVLMHQGLLAVARKQKAVKILTELGLKDRLDNYPAELSVGQQQRVAVARTLVNDPVLILADEPTGDVDRETAQEIVDLLLPRVRSAKTSIIVATHGSFDLSCADRVLTLKDGVMTESSGGNSVA
ncbi:MAG: ABC transporter ATP-binding protein [Erysipelotrichia bacterium]|nr:ABC transporter ATP-binding protein [Candidatus Riflebacteria bacterium]NCB38181.1 ABC transporter ATP-binding protein [Erysipelotrichia bacterium]